MIVWLASYPKSGNTWLRALISSYIYSQKGEFDFSLLKNIEQFPSDDNLVKFKDKLKNPTESIKYFIDEQKKINIDKKIRFLKTHSAFFNFKDHSFTDNMNSLGAIHIVRDPRNLISSLSNHYSSTLSESLKFMQDEDRCIVKKKDDSYLSYVPLFSWKSHQESWSNCVKIPVLTLRYEDLQNETFSTFKKVILFIKEITKQKISFDRDKAKRSINSCEFNKLQKLEEEKGFAESVINEKTKKKIKFFNLGSKNNYKELLNAELVKNMNNLYNKQLKKYGYEQ